MNDNARVESLAGKVALVTGAGRGWGRAAALALAAAGAHVAAVDFSPVTLDETIDMIHAGGGQASSYVSDTARGMAVRGLISEVQENHAHLDILVNAAWTNPRFVALEMDEWDWQRTLDVNLSGPFLLTQAVGRTMTDHQVAGVMINVVCSPASRQEETAHGAFYAAQAGMLPFSRAVAAQFLPYNIHVALLCVESDAEAFGTTGLALAEALQHPTGKLVARLGAHSNEYVSGQVWRVYADRIIREGVQE